jgi:hypothetical protein
VHGEDLLIDDGGDGQAVEAVRKGLPQLDVVSTFALIVEAVDSVDGSALVVASQDKEVLGILDLVCEKEANGLEGLLSSVDVVAKKEIVGFGRETAVLKQAQQIIILPMNVAADLNVYKWVSIEESCGAIRAVRVSTTDRPEGL